MFNSVFQGAKLLLISVLGSKEAPTVLLSRCATLGMWLIFLSSVSPTLKMILTGELCGSQTCRKGDSTSVEHGQCWTSTAGSSRDQIQ